VPVSIPANIPVVELIVPIVSTLLLQVPSVEASLKLVEPPGHIPAVPFIAAGAAFTVSILVIVQPVDVAVYVIVVVPCDAPVTTPDANPTVATPILLLAHVPAPVTSLNVVLPG
jgi:hypothetical protein